MILLDHAPYAPFMDRRTGKPPGLQPMPAEDWTVVHDDFPAQMGYRTDLLIRERGTVLGTLSESRDAQRELFDRMIDYLATRPDYQVGHKTLARPDGVVVDLDDKLPLDTLCRLIAEDLCLLLPDASSGEYRLVAAVLCFPSRWLLAEKLGRPLTVIHDPVPDYDDTLSRRVNRIFEALHADRPLVRVNWLVHANPELFQPFGVEAKKRMPPELPGPLYLRTERQGLVRLPRSGAVVFSIKSTVTPITALSAAQAGGLLTALGGVDEAGLAYRGGISGRALALRTLAEKAGL